MGKVSCEPPWKQRTAAIGTSFRSQCGQRRYTPEGVPLVLSPRCQDPSLRWARLDVTGLRTTPLRVKLGGKLVQEVAVENPLPRGGHTHTHTL